MQSSRRSTGFVAVLKEVNGSQQSSLQCRWILQDVHEETLTSDDRLMCYMCNVSATTNIQTKHAAVVRLKDAGSSARGSSRRRKVCRAFGLSRSTSGQEGVWLREIAFKAHPRGGQRLSSHAIGSLTFKEICKAAKCPMVHD